MLTTAFWEAGIRELGKKFSFKEELEVRGEWVMMSNKSDEAEMTFFFLSLLSVKEGMDFFFFFK